VSAIQTDRLTKFYGRHRGIEDLTMTVEPGEVFGFLGPNGAGKTTTIRTLLDLLHPSAGSARILGLDSHRDSVAIRKRIGNLPGDFGFGKHTSGGEALTVLARLRGVDGLGRAAELAARLRADLSRPLGQLSRGNRQKVGLILALFHRPELLIFDEPTGGLDPLMQEEFLALVAEERDRGCTIFLSSHELDEVQRVCDRVGIIRDGRLVAVERVADLIGKTRRHVEVEFAAPVDLAGLAGLRACPGVSKLQAHAAHVSFDVAGDLDPAIKEISRHTVMDLDFAHPALEQVFLSYYEDRPGSDANRGADASGGGGGRSAAAEAPAR
jgi:ABC-2 type transport system ATP-binding protein